MKGYCPLASGSKGNATYVGTSQTKILIDAGISGRATERKLGEIGVELDKIDAILISHPHTDHIQGLKTLALKYGIPVLANSETAKGIYHVLRECPKFKIFTTGESFTFQDIEIHPFSVQHDTVDPVAFTLQMDGQKLGICTDLGFATTLVKTHLRECDYLILESNHEPSMVHACSRPMTYKQRVLGRSGHLSNDACSSLLKELVHPKLRHVHLAHLSEECNAPNVALEKARQAAGNTCPITIAPQGAVGEHVLFS